MARAMIMSCYVPFGKPFGKDVDQLDSVVLYLVLMAEEYMALLLNLWCVCICKNHIRLFFTHKIQGGSNSRDTVSDVPSLPYYF